MAIIGHSIFFIARFVPKFGQVLLTLTFYFLLRYSHTIPFHADELKLKSVNINDRVNIQGTFVNGALEVKNIEPTDNETLELNSTEMKGIIKWTLQLLNLAEHP